MLDTVLCLPACLPAANERPIPSYPVQFNVLAYGAKGDGVAGKGDARPATACHCHMPPTRAQPAAMASLVPATLPGAAGLAPHPSGSPPADDTKAVLAALKAASAAAARLGVPKVGWLVLGVHCRPAQLAMSLCTVSCLLPFWQTQPPVLLALTPIERRCAADRHGQRGAGRGGGAAASRAVPHHSVHRAHTEQCGGPRRRGEPACCCRQHRCQHRTGQVHSPCLLPRPCLRAYQRLVGWAISPEPSCLPRPALPQVDKTVLYFPRALQHVYGNLMAWSYMGGFLTCAGQRSCMGSSTSVKQPTSTAALMRWAGLDAWRCVCSPPGPSNCRCRGRRYDSAVTQFQLARVTGAARKGDRRLSVRCLLRACHGPSSVTWLLLFTHWLFALCALPPVD